MSDGNIKKIDTRSSIDIGDIEEEPYVYGPYIVVIWVVKGYESCWIPHYDFKIISKGSKK